MGEFSSYLAVIGDVEVFSADVFNQIFLCLTSVPIPPHHDVTFIEYHGFGLALQSEGWSLDKGPRYDHLLFRSYTNCGTDWPKQSA